MKQFTKINESEVTSTEGYSVKFTHNKLTYKEGKRVISIDIEHEVDPYKLVVFTGTLRGWYPPFSLESVSKVVANRFLLTEAKSPWVTLAWNLSLNQTAGK